MREGLRWGGLKWGKGTHALRQVKNGSRCEEQGVGSGGGVGRRVVARAGCPRAGRAKFVCSGEEGGGVGRSGSQVLPRPLSCGGEISMPRPPYDRMLEPGDPFVSLGWLAGQPGKLCVHSGSTRRTSRGEDKHARQQSLRRGRRGCHNRHHFCPNCPRTQKKDGGRVDFTVGGRAGSPVPRSRAAVWVAAQSPGSFALQAAAACFSSHERHRWAAR